MPESDVASHQDRIEGITSAATQFVERGHFDADNIAHKQKVLTDRYAALQTPMAIRKQRLLDSLQVSEIAPFEPTFALGVLYNGQSYCRNFFSTSFIALAGYKSIIKFLAASRNLSKFSGYF